MATYNAELRKTLLGCDLDEADTDSVLANLARIGLVTPTDFAGYFAPECESLHGFWKGVGAWAGKGAILSKIRAAHRKFLRVEKQMGKEEEIILDPTLDNPIHPKINESITSLWIATYGFRFHPHKKEPAKSWLPCGGNCRAGK